MVPRPPTHPLFPYTTLFRSNAGIARNTASQPVTTAAYEALRGTDSQRLAHRFSVHLSSAPFATASERRTAMASKRSEEHTSELQSPCNLVCRPLLEKKKQDL